MCQEQPFPPSPRSNTGQLVSSSHPPFHHDVVQPSIQPIPETGRLGRWGSLHQAFYKNRITEMELGQEIRKDSLAVLLFCAGI